MNNFSRRTIRLTTFAMFCGVLAGTLMPGEAKEIVLAPFPPELHVDKLGHFIGFAALAYSGARWQPHLRTVFVLVAALLLAAGTEFLQNFIPGRYPLVTDVLIDTAGAAAGLAVLALFSVPQRRTQSVRTFSDTLATRY